MPPRTFTVPACTALVAVAALLTLPALAGARAPHVSPTSPTGTYAEGSLLANGRLVSPVGDRTRLGNYPVGIAVSPDGRTAVVADSGQGQGAPQQGDEALEVVDLGNGRVVQTVRDHEPGKPTFYNAGLAFSRDGRHLYAAGGGNDQVYDYAVERGRLRLLHRWRSSLKAGAPTVGGVSIAGGVPSSAPSVGDVGGFSRAVAPTADGSALVVTNEQGSTVAALSATDGHVLWETPLGAAGMTGGAYPEGVAVAGGTALVAAQGLNAVAVLDTTTGALKGLAPVGDHPVSVTVTKDGRSAWVANANDDSVSVLDLTAAPVRQVAQHSTHLVQGEANGSTPTAVAFAGDRAYVALAGDDAVQVMSLDGRVLGAVPTGQYPTALDVSRGRLAVVSAKGLGSVPVTNLAEYDGNDIAGLLTRVPVPTQAQLPAYTRQAVNGLLFGTRSQRLRPAGSPIPDEAHRGQSPIKHVVMVVRENRTFDQVFGDLKRADVDPRYLEFGARDRRGRSITPNAHALAARFGLSQNFYSDGEASIQGHHWTAEGVSTDYTEKSWVHYYSDRNHAYDPVGSIVYPRCGAVFQQLAAQGKTFRNYGELVGLATSQAPTVQAAPGSDCATPGGRYDAASAAAFDPNLGANVSLTSVSDVDKEKEFEKSWAPLAAADRTPQFSYLVMGNDHTDGTAPGKKTPQAHVATNDLAIGKLVDYLSHTPQWGSTAVFFVEDDSQDGLDHRDGHRNIALVASPWVRPGALSSLHISQASVLHTIELVLGLRPLSSYTQYSAVPYDLFTSTPDLRPYTAVSPTYPLSLKNGAAPKGSAASLPLDLSEVDVAGPLLEAQLWEATHPGSPMPQQLLAELAARAPQSRPALADWARGRACSCRLDTTRPEGDR